MQPSVTQSYARVQAWIVVNQARRDEIATSAGVDEKTLRLAVSPNWNPTKRTLEKLEKIIPADWQPTVGAGRRRAAA